MKARRSVPNGVRLRSVGMLCLFALPSFLGAALFLQLQPLVGSILLPQLGGAPAVWVTCLGFFQLLLFGGYLFTHLATRKLSHRGQALLQALLLALVLVRGPLLLPSFARLDATSSPSWLLLGFLLAHVALSGFVLSTTSPLLQSWYAAISGDDPYPLYAVSNAGSMLGLLAYPLLIEPLIALHVQQHLWALAFGVYAASLLVLCALVWRKRSTQRRGDGPKNRRTWWGPSARDACGWLALSAAPSALLASISNHITVDVPASPLLWTAPLALYLGSFILAFSRPHAQRAELYAGAFIACTVALPILLLPGNEARLSVVLAVPLVTLWVGAMICHGLLAERRPDPSQLTAYYAVIAAGGALGGGFVAFAAPFLFADHYELVLSLLAIHALQAWFSQRRDRSVAPTGTQRFAWLGIGLAVPVLVATLWVQVAGLGRQGHMLERTRDFFGPLQVSDTQRVRVLTHGRTDQGQALRDPAHQAEPVGYVGQETAVARALRLHARGRPRQLGVLGLGVGALAAYAQRGDELRFYEINAAVERLARRWFVYLSRTRGSVSVVHGDGRLALTHEPAQHFDVFVLDAFSSDAIPVHLLTVEAFTLYLQKLRPDGLLLVNVSNRHLRVESVVAASAREHGLACVVLESSGDVGRGLVRARWAVMARRRELIEPLLGAPAREVEITHQELWTDDHASLLSIAR